MRQIRLTELDYKDRLKSKLLENRVLITGHWIWTGAKNIHGRGQKKYRGKQYSVERLSTHVFLGLDLNSKQFACHKDDICGRKDCFNPDHLYVGNKDTNAKDRSILNTHCPQGHEYTRENTYTDGGKSKHCRRCRRIRDESNRNELKKKE